MSILDNAKFAFIHIGGYSDDEIFASIRAAAKRLKHDVMPMQGPNDKHVMDLIQNLKGDPLELLYDPEDELSEEKVQFVRYLVVAKA